jgi:hypothetical protein
MELLIIQKNKVKIYSSQLTLFNWHEGNTMLK